MNWLFLLLAGLFEVVWAIGLKHTEGFTKVTLSLITIGAMGASFFLLSLALRTLPLGTAYAAWVGIGVVGTAVAGILLFQETLTPLKLGSLVLVVVGIMGLKLASAS